MHDPSSRDTTSLGLDALAQPGLERGPGHEINPDPKALLEEELETHESVERGGTDKIDEHVHVARLQRFTTSHRTEHGEVQHAEARTCSRQQLGKALEGNVSVHAMSIPCRLPRVPPAA